MRPPCELIQSELLTGMRGFIALHLYEKDKKKFSQSKIAEILSISQPVVHSYLKLSKEQILEQYSLLREESVQKQIQIIIDDIVKGVPAEQLINHICSVCYLLRVKGVTCVLHRTIIPLAKDCQACLPNNLSLITRSRMRVIQALEESAKQFVTLVTETAEQLTLIPEVGTQFAFAFDTQPLESSDIAAFPGRIVKVGTGAKIVSPAEFNVSKTSSTILLAFHNNQNYRSIICIKNTELLRNSLKNFEDVFKIHTKNNGEQNWGATLPPLIPSQSYTYTSIIDKGGVGVEALIYLLGSNPEAILQLLNVIHTQHKTATPSKKSEKASKTVTAETNN